MRPGWAARAPAVEPAVAAALIAALGGGAVLALGGAGASAPLLAALGALVVGVALVLLFATAWADGMLLLAVSLPLPALYSADALRLAPPALLTAALVAAWVLRWSADDRKPRLPPVPFAAMLTFLAVLMVSAAFAERPLPAAREIANFVLLFGLLAGATYELRGSPGRCHSLALALAGVAAVSGLLAAVQSVGLLPARFALAETGFFRATLGFGWPNEFGTFMALLLPLTLHAASTARGLRGRVLGVVMVASAMAGLAATFSRGSWLAFLAAAPVLLVVGERRVVLRIATISLLAAFAAAALFGGAIVSRVVGTVSDPYVAQRLALTYTGALMFLDNPLLGVGPGNFVHALETYGPQVIWLWDYVGSAHNAYVDTAAEAGILGLVALLALLAALLRTLIRGARSAHLAGARSVEGSLRLALLWSFSVACLAGFTVWPFAHGIGQAVMLIAAMGVALESSASAETGAARRTPP